MGFQLLKQILFRLTELVDIPRYPSDMNLIGLYSRNNRNYS